ncbi:hypothetical protein CDAR_74071 [Caerostris darwini]|uniref:Uncharacterized protein n=1 Tax=Caerostris darwini TaxID=1538125 RepID=A0AAV4Q843_9ARAC|nr:hypothetical protein CDAR_74071 [Caerostris darwini]
MPHEKLPVLTGEENSGHIATQVSHRSDKQLAVRTISVLLSMWFNQSFCLLFLVYFVHRRNYYYVQTPIVFRPLFPHFNLQTHVEDTGIKSALELTDEFPIQRYMTRIS